MKTIECPINGVRPLQEFLYGGQVRSMPDPNCTSDKEWAEYLFNRAGEPGVVSEWWFHLPSGTWFVAERDVVRDRVLRTYVFTGGMSNE